MMRFSHRIGHDLRHLRNIDVYAVSLAAFVFAVLSVTSDILTSNARWAVLLVGVSVLVFRVTLPERSGATADDVLKDRSAFEDKPFSTRLRQARELWVFLRSAINLLGPDLRCHAFLDSLLCTALSNIRAVRIAQHNPHAYVISRFSRENVQDFSVFGEVQPTVSQDADFTLGGVKEVPPYLTWPVGLGWLSPYGDPGQIRTATLR